MHQNDPIRPRMTQDFEIDDMVFRGNKGEFWANKIKNIDRPP